MSLIAEIFATLSVQFQSLLTQAILFLVAQKTKPDCAYNTNLVTEQCSVPSGCNDELSGRNAHLTLTEQNTTMGACSSH